MIRVVTEAIITITVLLMARAIISSILQSFGNKTSTSRRTTKNSDGFRPEDHTAMRGTLHRDPVCGTFVPETTPFRREVSGSHFYYCSEVCREAHARISPNMNRQGAAAPKASKANP
jgi:YHS domain-containing protein